MNELTLLRYVKRAEGNGANQTLDNVDKKSLITQVIIANDDGAIQHDVKVLLNGDPLILALVDGSGTYIQELAVPIKPTDSLVYYAAASVHLTLVFAEMG